MTSQFPQPPYPPPPAPRPPSNPWWRRGWGIAAIAVVTLLVGTGIGSASGGKSETKAVAGPTVTATATATTTAPAPPAGTVTLKPTVIRTIATRTRTHTVTYTPPPKPAISDGTYEVGTDIRPGEWRTKGGQDCYYAILNSTDSSDIADNGNSSGQQIANLTSGKYFEISGGCDWRHV